MTRDISCRPSEIVQMGPAEEMTDVLSGRVRLHQGHGQQRRDRGRPRVHPTHRFVTEVM